MDKNQQFQQNDQTEHYELLGTKQKKTAQVYNTQLQCTVRQYLYLKDCNNLFYNIQYQVVIP